MPILSSQSLLEILSTYPYRHYVLAYSGGVDSHVLLHCLAKLQQIGKIQPFRAIHINHGLQAVAETWGQHCQKVANELKIPCEVVNLNLSPKKGESLEAIARTGRYQVFSQQLKNHEILLTAHHQNDQAETVLLQLFRGSGVDGLAAMPTIRPFHKGQLLRPLLHYSRDCIIEYAQQHQLDYIDDPSNFDTDFDRNFLRHEVLPLLQTRWKGIHATLSRVAYLQSEAKHLLAEYTQVDLDRALNPNKNTLYVEQLKTFTSQKQKAVIRLWLQQQSYSMPSAIKLQHILSDTLYAKQGATPCVHWKNIEIRVHQKQLYVMSRLKTHNAQQMIVWKTITEDLFIPSLKQYIMASVVQKWFTTHQIEVKQGKICVRFRQGGERIHLIGHKHHSRVKKLLHAANIPPWQRDRIPLIYFDDRLIMIYPNWSAKYESIGKNI